MTRASKRAVSAVLLDPGRSAPTARLGVRASRAATSRCDAGAAVGGVPRRRCRRGFSYSWFCDLYRAWAGRLKPTMPQIHLAGDKLSVDLAGRAGEVIDAVPVRIFVAVPPGQPATWHAPAGTHPCAEVARCRAHPYGRS
jgi:hypothetical protein